jgi:transcriptional regulator with XRE-family HTH domain
MATLRVSELGEYIRDQRRTAQISLRQLAKAAGVSNPYLSQIERGLRKPSAEILQQIAKALRISAEALYVQAGFLEERDGESDVKASLLGDSWITERQKQVLIEIYDSFRKENALLAGAEQAPATKPAVAPKKKTPTARRTRTTTPKA